MTVGKKREDWVKEVDTILKKWCQGDYVLGEHWFFHRYNPQRPLTQDSENDTQEETDILESEVRGFVVVTQTCDIVRTCISRAFVEVVPLVEIDELALREVQKARRPQYAYIPGVASLNLVADLDRVMTVEKPVLAEWERQTGCFNDEQTKALGQALARKRARFAFPDDFNEFAKKLQKRLKEKHDKHNDEGEALRALLEIRVNAEPSWNASEVKLVFWFIRSQEQITYKGIDWNQLLKQWLNLIPAFERFKSVDGSVVTLDDITAKEYIESYPLDLDHLSL